MHVATIRLNTPKTVGPPICNNSWPGGWTTRGVRSQKKGALKLDRLSFFGVSRWDEKDTMGSLWSPVQDGAPEAYYFRGFIPSYTHLQPWFFIGFAGVIQ